MLTLPADAQIEHSPALLAQLDSALGGSAGDFVVDASALRQFDTSTLSLLLQARRLAAQRGGTLEVRGAPAKLRELARLYGVEELLPLAGGVSAAEADASGATA